MQDRIGAQFFLMALAFLESIQNVILVCTHSHLVAVPEERAVLLRDQASSLYGLLPYFLSKIVAELPLNVLSPVYALLLGQWLFGLNDARDYNFWINSTALCKYVVFNMILMYLAACGYGIVAGAVMADRDGLINLIPVLSGL